MRHEQPAMIETLVSVVAPLEGEGGAAIEAFVEETVKVLSGLVTHYEIVLVDDATTDDSVPQAREMLAHYDFIRLLRLSRRFGEETAIAAGLDVAIGDYVIVMLPNMDPPALIREFVEKARSQGDIVYGVRTHRRAEPLVYRVGAATFYWLVNGVLHAGIPKDSTQFRCMTRPVVNAITQIRGPDRYLRLLTSYVGFRKQPLPYAPIDRNGRPTARPTIEAIGLARTLLLEQSSLPLRWVAWGAVTVSFICLVSRAAVSFFVTTLVLAMIAEYVIGITGRLRDRPAYYVREEHASSVLLREERRNVVHHTA